jgi:DNA-binding NtrC family response regulator
MSHILFIDDHEMLLESLRLTLEHEYLVSLAASVPEAFALMAVRMPDIICVDYLMPYLNGLDFLEMVKSMIKQPKVIFFSGALSRRVEVQAMQAGAAACLAKPFELEELKLVMERVMKG